MVSQHAEVQKRVRQKQRLESLIEQAPRPEKTVAFKIYDMHRILHAHTHDYVIQYEDAAHPTWSESVLAHGGVVLYAGSCVTTGILTRGVVYGGRFVRLLSTRLREGTRQAAVGAERVARAVGTLEHTLNDGYKRIGAETLALERRVRFDVLEQILRQGSLGVQNTAKGIQHMGTCTSQAVAYAGTGSRRALSYASYHSVRALHALWTHTNRALQRMGSGLQQGYAWIQSQKKGIRTRAQSLATTGAILALGSLLPSQASYVQYASDGHSAYGDLQEDPRERLDRLRTTYTHQIQDLLSTGVVHVLKPFEQQAMRYDADTQGDFDGSKLLVDLHRWFRQDPNRLQESTVSGVYHVPVRALHTRKPLPYHVIAVRISEDVQEKYRHLNRVSLDVTTTRLKNTHPQHSAQNQ